jgi:hypothetical protein
MIVDFGFLNEEVIEELLFFFEVWNLKFEV